MDERRDGEPLRHAADGAATAAMVPRDDVQRLAEIVKDLADDEVMSAAWSLPGSATKPRSRLAVGRRPCTIIW